MTTAETLPLGLAEAVAELVATFGEGTRVAAADAGGAWIEVADIDLGDRWSPRSTWIAFHIAVTYPYADIYPLFMRSDCRLSTGGLPTAVTENAAIPTSSDACLQISRKSNAWDASRDTAAAKVLKVIEWLRCQ